ncbi:DUF2894 domain-containing protein [Paraburkholderia rhizosphaerae]|uniref:DUF2894 family protein n=1 Tax=Paraburkholderia rhizosphaerae TaxID=480658 RepID=A0A4R8LZ96_9BURK|nr:DUF2894 domain-containing protein [Paraburkholderia rhizosphaerae]TDY52169.1 Protein of unknown function (DUF2894) [Paraburkholderia rhizosphaerae]
MSDVRETRPVCRSASDDAGCGDARATLERWRETGADRLNPLRFAMIDALARRIEKLPTEGGEFRRRLVARLAALITAYDGDVGRMRDGQEAEASASSTVNAPGGSSLAALTASLSERADGAGTLADMLRYFDAIWSKLSAGRQLRQSLAQVPGNAGPLNSSRLVYRALSLMNELSPEHLQHFLVYVETLSALGELGGGGTQAPSAENAPRAKDAKGVKQPAKRKSKG